MARYVRTDEPVVHEGLYSCGPGEVHDPESAAYWRDVRPHVTGASEVEHNPATVALRLAYGVNTGPPTTKWMTMGHEMEPRIAKWMAPVLCAPNERLIRVLGPTVYQRWEALRAADGTSHTSQPDRVKVRWNPATEHWEVVDLVEIKYLPVSDVPEAIRPPHRTQTQSQMAAWQVPHNTIVYWKDDMRHRTIESTPRPGWEDTVLLPWLREVERCVHTYRTKLDQLLWQAAGNGLCSSRDAPSGTGASTP